VGDPEADGSAGHPFGTILEGVEAASEDATIYVLAGSYSGVVELSQPGLTVLGEGSDVVHLGLENGQTGFHIAADGVTVSGFEISGGLRGVHIEGLQGASLSGGELQDLLITALHNEGFPALSPIGVLIEFADDLLVDSVTINLLESIAVDDDPGEFDGEPADVIGISVKSSAGLTLLNCELSQLASGAGLCEDVYIEELGDVEPGNHSGGNVTGIYFDGCSKCLVTACSVHDLLGGQGGPVCGDENGLIGKLDALPGGEASAIVLHASQQAFVSETSVDGVFGGTGGEGSGWGGYAGRGGTSSGMRVLGSDGTVVSECKVNSIKGGELSSQWTGGDGGDAVGIEIEGPGSVELEHLAISLVSGQAGGSGSDDNPAGGSGGGGAGIRATSLGQLLVSGCSVTVIEGGAGGLVGEIWGPYGAGGEAIGVHVKDVSVVVLDGNRIWDVVGGAASDDGNSIQTGGPGGRAAGVSIGGADQSCVLSELVVAAVTGGRGGAGLDEVFDPNKGGSGGNAVGVEIASTNGSCSLVGATLHNVTAGEGGDGLPEGKDGVALGLQALSVGEVDILDTIFSGTDDGCFSGSNISVAYSDLWACENQLSDDAVVPETCFGEDPLFVDAENNDLHLLPNSPCIDAGDPVAPYSLEPEPNGCRVNQGGYGNTAWAASKPGAEQCGEYVPNCDGKECGDDGYGGSCGECGQYLCVYGSCVCMPDCDGKQCGFDGCGGSCGKCDDDDACVEGACVCQPACDGMECGDNGCDGNCGECGNGDVCEGGQCVESTWTDPISGLTWQVTPKGGSMHWEEAKSHCSSLDLTGGGWHLPTIGELRTLIRGCPATEMGGTCNVEEEDCMAQACMDDSCWGCSADDGPADGCYWPNEISGVCSMLKRWWSSSPSFADSAWVVRFDSGRVASHYMGWGGDVRCVR